MRTAVSNKSKVGRPKKDTIQTSTRITSEANTAWEKTAAKLGVSKTAVIEMALRKFASDNGVELPNGE